jgi:hypothetical protein
MRGNPDDENSVKGTRDERGRSHFHKEKGFFSSFSLRISHLQRETEGSNGMGSGPLTLRNN